MDVFGDESEKKTKHDFGDDGDDAPSAAEFAKSLLLGGVEMFGGDDDDKLDGETNREVETAGSVRATKKSDDTWAQNSRPGTRMDLSRFKPQDEWWQSAEAALEMLVKERESLKKSTQRQPGQVEASLLAANRFITTKIQEMVSTKIHTEAPKFRDGIEEIAAVLPPDTQREFHQRLCAAAKKGEMEIIRSMLRFQIDLDMSDAFGTPLHYACVGGHLDAVQELLDNGAYAGALNMRDQTPLHVAAALADPACLDMLIHYGARINAKDSGGLTALHMAASKGYSKLIEKLILGGADVDIGNSMGWTPLHMAAMGMHHDVMYVLCNQGMADPNAKCSFSSMLGKPGDPPYLIFNTIAGDTPAHFAARKGHYLCLKALLEHGAKLDVVNDNGETLAHAAVESSEIRVLELMLEYGWDFLGKEDKHGRDSIDFCDVKILKLMSPEHAEARTGMAKIKELLTKMTQKRNLEKHRELIEAARQNLNPRKKKGKLNSEQTEMSQRELEIDTIEVDEKTMDDKLLAMRLELEAARAAVKALETQTKVKTYALNDTLLETKRMLSEAQYELERERRARLDLEKGILETLQRQQEEGGATGDEEELEKALNEEEGVGSTLYGRDRGVHVPEVLRIISTAYSREDSTALSSRQGTADGLGGYRRMPPGTEREGFDKYDQLDGQDFDFGTSRGTSAAPSRVTSAGGDDYYRER